MIRFLKKNVNGIAITDDLVRIARDDGEEPLTLTPEILGQLRAVVEQTTNQMRACTHRSFNPHTDEFQSSTLRVHWAIAMEIESWKTDPSL